MENLIATCYVIQSNDYGVEPVIYLRRPNTSPNNEKLHGFDDPFTARAFIREYLTESVQITVTKETQSQLLLVQS